jgi:hypothetical protein
MKVLSSKNPTFHSMMLRQYALLADVAGQRRKALKLCAEALALARSQGSNYEAALADTYLARWRYESETGDRDQVAETQAKVDAIESTLLLTFEKYALLKAPGTSNTR